MKLTIEKTGDSNYTLTRDGQTIGGLALHPDETELPGQLQQALFGVMLKEAQRKAAQVKRGSKVFDGVNPADIDTNDPDFLLAHDIAFSEMLERTDPIQIELTPGEAWMILGVIQLASRHPQMATSPSMAIAIEFAVGLQERVAREGFLALIGAMGWNENFDVRPSGATTMFNEGQRQMVLLALHKLRGERPGWDIAIGDIEQQLGGQLEWPPNDPEQ